MSVGEGGFRNGHLTIVVAEGKVTMQELQRALEQAVVHIVKGGCNCGLTGFDLSFVRGDPALAELGKIPNIRAGIFSAA